MTTALASFHRRRQWRTTSLSSFFAWWAHELLAMLPRILRDALARGPTWRLIEIDAATSELRLRRCDEAVPIVRIDLASSPQQQLAMLRNACASVDPNDLRLALCLAPDAALRRRVDLPVAALDHPDQVLAFEIERQTPFAAKQVYYDARKLTAITPGKVPVELIVTPRVSLDPHLARLAAAGIDVDAVDIADGHGRFGVNLLPPTQRPHHVCWQRRLNIALGVLVLVLLLTIMNLWLENRRNALATMQARVDTMQVQARTVSALRQQLAHDIGATGFAIQRKAQVPRVVAVLDDLSRRLPDTTWLDRMSIGQGRVNMQGQSAQAADLIDVLMDSKLLVEPGFRGAIKTDPITGKQNFYVVAQLRTTSAQELANAPQTP